MLPDTTHTSFGLVELLLINRLRISKQSVPCIGNGLIPRLSSQNNDKERATTAAKKVGGGGPWNDDKRQASELKHIWSSDRPAT